jgi:hypothetical protein
MAFPTVPEPSTLLLLGQACLAGIAFSSPAKNSTSLKSGCDVSSFRFLLGPVLTVWLRAPDNQILRLLPTAARTRPRFAGHSPPVVAELSTE